MAHQSPHLLDFPDEILLNILSHLKKDDMFWTVGLACHKEGPWIQEKCRNTTCTSQPVPSSLLDALPRVSLRMDASGVAVATSKSAARSTAALVNAEPVLRNAFRVCDM